MAAAVGGRGGEHRPDEERAVFGEVDRQARALVATDRESVQRHALDVGSRAIARTAQTEDVDFPARGDERLGFAPNPRVLFVVGVDDHAGSAWPRSRRALALIGARSGGRRRPGARGEGGDDALGRAGTRETEIRGAIAPPGRPNLRAAPGLSSSRSGGFAIETDEDRGAARRADGSRPTRWWIAGRGRARPAMPTRAARRRNPSGRPRRGVAASGTCDSPAARSRECRPGSSTRGLPQRGARSRVKRQHDRTVRRGDGAEERGPGAECLGRAVLGPVDGREEITARAGATSRAAPATLGECRGFAHFGRDAGRQVEHQVANLDHSAERCPRRRGWRPPRAWARTTSVDR